MLASGQLGIGERKAKDAPDASSNHTAYTVEALRKHFPNVSLLTQNKKAVHFYEDTIKNKIVMIQFIPQISMISKTVDPIHYNPQVLRDYADGFSVQPGWQFLTGKKADIDLIRRNPGVYDPDAQKIAHRNVLTIGNERTSQLAGNGDIR